MPETLEQLQQISAAVASMKPYPPPSHRWRDLQRLKDKMAAVQRDPSADPEALSLHASRTAYSLWQMALATQDWDLLQTVFGFWIQCGPVGWALAARHLMVKCNRSTRDVYASVLDSLSETERLLLLNQFTMMQRPAEPSARELVSKALFQAKRREPKDYVGLLTTLRRLRATLSPAVEDLLYREGFWAWAANELQPGADAEHHGRVLSALEQLGRPLPKASVVELLGASRDKDAALLQALARLGAEDTSVSKAVLDLVRSASDTEVKLAAVEALLKLNTPQVEKVFLYLLKKEPDPKVLQRLCLLDAGQMNSLLDQLDEAARTRLDQALLELFVRCDPEWVTQFLADYLEKVPRIYPLDQQSLLAVRDFVIAHDQNVAGLQPPQGPQQEDPGKTQRKSKGSSLSLGKVFKKETVKDEAASALEKLQEGKDLYGADFSGRTLDGLELAELTVSLTSFSRGTISSSHFQSVNFRDCDFADCRIDNAYFSNCSFENCRFTQAELSQCLLQWIFMKSCTFENAWLHDGEVTGMVCSRSSFMETRLQKMDIGRSMVRETAFTQAGLEECVLRACKLEGADLSDARFAACRINGLELVDCVLHRTLLAKTHADNVKDQGCHFLQLHGYGLHTSSPGLLAAAHQGRRERLLLNQPCNAPLDIPDWTANEQCSIMLQLLVDNWFPKEDAARREGRYAAYCKRRWSMALEPQPPAAREFFSLLPSMLQTGLPGDAGKSKHPLHLDIAGYHPDFACWEILQKQYDTLDFAEPGKNALPVAGLHAMGQLGTLAQPGGSEFELLLLLDVKELDEQTLKTLKRRLEHIQAFARKQHGVDVRFTVATPASIRYGQFSLPRWEDLSPGEAALQKEQLSRTLLPLYGKTPSWWLTPPGVSEEEHHDHLEQLVELPYFFNERTVDLGFPLKVLPQEFFGACLFELANVFDNPFVCLMRYGMLVRFLKSGNAAEVFVFDKIKQRVFEGSWDLEDVDPWAALFKETFRFLNDSGDRKAAELTGLAFALQTGGRDAGPELDHAWAGHKSRFIQDFFQNNENAGAVIKHCRAAESSFEYMIKSGQVFGSFLHQAVNRLARQVAEDDALDIDPEFLDLLQRKMDVLFSRRKAKVARIPFLRPVHRRFKHVILFCEKSAGRTPTWILRGVPVELKVKKDNLAEIRRENDLARLLCWYTLNGLYNPDCHFEVDYSANPIKPKDVRNLLFLMDVFFVRSQSLHTDLAFMARPEAVMRALFMLNLTTKRDVNAIFESSTAYATSWGDVFCQTDNVFGNQLRDEPKAFLRKVSPLTVTQSVKLASFKPDKSRCPDINLPGARKNAQENDAKSPQPPPEQAG